MAHAEHPLITAHGAHAATHLVCERLKGEALICRCQGAGNAIARSVRFFGFPENINCFLEPALKQVLVRGKGDQPGGVGFGAARSEFAGQMESADRIEEKERADPFVKVIAVTAEGFQVGARCQQFAK